MLLMQLLGLVSSVQDASNRFLFPHTHPMFAMAPRMKMAGKAAVVKLVLGIQK